MNPPSLWQTFFLRGPEIVNALVQHLYLSFLAVLFACLIAIPVGIWIVHRPRLSAVAMTIASVLQTIPSLALLGFLIPLAGIGAQNALVALTIYGLLPILQNTTTGLRDIDPALVEAGRGMGMTQGQLMRIVLLPLARPFILAGVRTATVLIIGLTTLVSLIGAGGLGDLIYRGISTLDNNLILAGAIPAALLAIAFDFGLRGVERWLTPKGLRKRKQASTSKESL